MSENYISQFYTWATGNTITAPRLNGNVSNVTDGLSSGVKAVNIGKLLIGGTETINSSRNGIFNGITLSSDVTTISYAIDWDLIDNTASALSFDASGKTGLLEFDTTDGAEGLKTSGFLRLGSDASTLTDVGAFVLGASNDSGLFFNGTDLTIQTDGAGASGIIFDSEDDTFEFKGSGVLQATFDTTGLNLVSGDVFKINGTSVLSNDTLGSGVVNTSITSTGALNSGSITSGFGNIDVGSSNIDGGTITADTALVGTLSTASQPNITAVGALDSGSITSGFGNIDVGSSSIDGGAFTASTLDISGNIRMPYSTSKYIIGPEQVASNTFRTTFDSIEINGADGLAGGSAMGGGSVIIRGGGAQGNSSTNSYGGHVKIYGGELLGGSTGAGQIYLYTNNTQRMIVSGSGLITGDFNDISDISLKKNVRDFERTGLEIIKDIQPRLFDWIEEEKGNNIYGFIAQELEEVMPTAIIQEDVKSINVTSIVSVLVHSVQELAKKVEILENK